MHTMSVCIRAYAMSDVAMLFNGAFVIKCQEGEFSIFTESSIGRTWTQPRWVLKCETTKPKHSGCHRAAVSPRPNVESCKSFAEPLLESKNYQVLLVVVVVVSYNL